MQQNLIMSEHDHARLTEVVQRETHQRGPEIDLLARKLWSAQVVRPGDVPRNVVTMWSLVGLRDLDRNEKISCTLSFPDEADVARHKVSVDVPLGAGLVAASVGDVFECPAPSGVRQLRVERIYYQPEAARDYHL